MENQGPVAWVEIPPLEFWLRGSGSSIQFVTNIALVDCKQRVVIVGFNVTLDLEGGNAPMRYSFNAGEVSGVRNFRDGLKALIDGNTSPVWLYTESGFSVGVQQVKVGLDDVFLVSGNWSTFKDVRYAPWPHKKSGNEAVLAEHSPAVCIQFAFLTDTVDPGYLKQTVLQLSALIRDLENLGYSDL